MSKIARLRELSGLDTYVGSYSSRDERVEEVDELLEELDTTEVHEEFEEGGRWSNYVTTVYRVTEPIQGDRLGFVEQAYFRVTREQPATEMQEGQDCSYQFDEVIPKQVVKTVYVEV
jgi:hypothetical protein